MEIRGVTEVIEQKYPKENEESKTILIGTQFVPQPPEGTDVVGIVQIKRKIEINPISILSLGIIIACLINIMIKKLKNKKENSKVSRFVIILLVISIIVLLCTGTYTYYLYVQ